MEIPFHRVDAFAPQPFTGAPAFVCVTPAFVPKPLALQIAAQTGCAETTFLTRAGDAWDVRWYTPEAELPLCTHAALAAGWVALEQLGGSAVTLRAPSGPMLVVKSGDLVVLDLPRLVPTPTDAPRALTAALRVPPREVLRAGKYVVVYSDEDDVRALAPDLDRLGELDAQGVIVTAPGRACDFVMRSFAIAEGAKKRPAVEEPVSGSAQSRLVPYWSERTQKTQLRAQVLSRRGAELHCTDTGGRLELGGRVVPFAEGTIRL